MPTESLRCGLQGKAGMFRGSGERIRAVWPCSRVAFRTGSLMKPP